MHAVLLTQTIHTLAWAHTLRCTVHVSIARRTAHPQATYDPPSTDLRHRLTHTDSRAQRVTRNSQHAAITKRARTPQLHMYITCKLTRPCARTRRAYAYYWRPLSLGLPAHSVLSTQSPLGWQSEWMITCMGAWGAPFPPSPARSPHP